MVLELLKINLGISTKARDTYLMSIIQSVINELTVEHNLSIPENQQNHERLLLFIVDYAAWRYRSRGEGMMPRNIQFRLHNLVLAGEEKNNG